METRRGFSLLEVVAGISILTTFSVILVPILQRQAAWRQELRRVQIAQFHLQNCAESLLSANKLAIPTAKEIETSLKLEEMLRVLPQGKGEAEVNSENGAIRVRLRLIWRSKPEAIPSKSELNVWLPRGKGA